MKRHLAEHKMPSRWYRLFGFDVFRKTYKPLLAESIVEFWNRYYYFFKELMMEFFFMPIYLRYFRDWPMLRIIAAVFAAAFIGNMYYHLLQAKNPIIDGDVYCFLLAAGIALSMLRQQRLRGRPVILTEPNERRCLPFAQNCAVWTFFALINFWNVTSAASIAERGRLFLAIFGL
jgi:hypothetical protein